MLIYKIKYYIKYYIVRFLGKIINDKTYTIIRYYLRHKKIPNLVEPRTFNEKVAYAKIYDKSEFRTLLADKYLVKDYVCKIIGKEHIIKTLYVTSDPSTINFDNLPSSFIIKANHGSGWCKIVKNKNNIDRKNIIKLCNHFLSMNFYYFQREHQYYNITPKIIIEELIIDSNGLIPDDYRFFSYNGTTKFIQVDLIRLNHHKRAFYDIDWNKVSVELAYPDYEKDILRPKKLNDMINIANILTKDLDFARVDLYLVSDQIYFGEITLTPGANLQRFKPNKYDEIFGSHYRLTR